MDLVSGYKGVVGRVFGGGNNSTSNEDIYVERLLDRISNSSLVEDRRAAITDLQSAVAESQAGQLAFGTMGFPVLFGVLKEERDDIEMVRGVLETLVSALTPIGHLKVTNNEIKPALMNADLLSREAESISLLLSLLSDEDFYIRYYTLQVLTALLTNTTNRLQEAILTIPRGITRLMDMLMDRGVIRNEALLLLTYLTRDAEEIQKIVVFEGAFEKIFSIINEEGGSEGGVVVQDCLELLRNLLRDNISNQKFLSETIGFDPLISILKHRGSAYSFTQQKTINILSALETVNLLIMERSEVEPRKGSGGLNNKTVLVQKNLMYHLLTLGVESQWAPVAVRCLALKCIGDLISGHSKNIETLANKLLGEEPRVEPAINSIFRIILRTSSRHEFVEADYIFKCFCEKNREGQAMLAVALSPQLHTVNHLNIPLDEDANVSFGSLLLRGITLCDSDGDLETCCKAACVLSHILKDNLECKEKVLQIEVEAPTPSLGSPEPLMHRVMKYLALASSMNNKESKASSRWNLYVEPIILKLLITWLANFPGAVHCLLGSRSNLTYLLELVLNSSTTVYVKGLAAIVLGECILFNETGNDGRDASTIVDAISQKVGLTTYFSIFDKMQQSLVAKSPQSRKPLTRSNTASMIEIEDVEESNTTEQKNEDDPVLLSIFDTQFIDLAKRLEADIRESIVNVYSHSKSEVVVVTADLEQRRGENGEEYIKRLKSIVVEQGSEIQDLLARNSTLAEDLANAGGRSYSQPEKSERYQIEKLRRELQDASQQLENLKLEKANIESEASMYQNLAQKMDSDLQSLSEAYNSLEQANYLLENEMRAMKSVGTTPLSDIEEIKAEAEKESEAELNDLLICLGQEQSKVERLTSRLLELGEDVEKLLEGIGDDMEMPEFAEEEED